MDEYIKNVYRALKCSKKEKKRIIIDLKSDILLSLENGESFEDIEKRLGNPVEFAEEFNENLGIVKKSNMKLIIGIVCGLVLAILCFVGYQYLTTPKVIELDESTIFKNSVVIEKSQEVVDYLSQSDYQGLESLYSEVLKEASSTEKITAAVKQLGELGEFKRISDSQFVEYHENNEVSAVGDVVVEYEKRTVIYRLSFNQDMKLIGLFMR